MQPATYNIVIHDRTTLDIIFTLKDDNLDVLDITGYVFDAQANGDTSWLPGGTLDLAPAIYGPATNGQIQIRKTVAQTDPLMPGIAPAPKWDMLMTDQSAVTTKILTGTLTILETQTP